MLPATRAHRSALVVSLVATGATMHTNISNEGGSNWIPTESWAFFNQF